MHPLLGAAEFVAPIAALAWTVFALRRDEERPTPIERDHHGLTWYPVRHRGRRAALVGAATLLATPLLSAAALAVWLALLVATLAWTGAGWSARALRASADGLVIELVGRGRERLDWSEVREVRVDHRRWPLDRTRLLLHTTRNGTVALVANGSSPEVVGEVADALRQAAGAVRPERAAPPPSASLHLPPAPRR